MPEVERFGALTVVLPFFNEEKYIAQTIRSLMDQTINVERFVLVDNASTDQSVAVIKSVFEAENKANFEIIQEETPGKIYALATGQKHVTTPFLAFCDADTFYPSHYLATAMELMGDDDTIVGVMGLGLTDGPETSKGRFQRRKGAFVGGFLAKQCHTGGYGHVFRTHAVRASGGYNPSLWPLMQADHEIVHRMLKQGRCLYHQDMWCQPSDRRSERSRVSWDGMEILVYHLTPFFLKDWYFYKFLKNRFEQRGMMNTNLRAQPWKDKAGLNS